MKKIKVINILTILVMVLAGIAAFIGILSNKTTEYSNIVTSFGETIKLYNKGIYARDSVSMATQIIAQDYVTLFMGIPLLIGSLWLFNKRKLVGLFVLTGTIAYFLYTYISYSFLVTYNFLYLVYLIIMTLSFYTFILCINVIIQGEICNIVKENFPIKLICRFMWITGVVLGGMWLGRIIPSIINQKAPVGLEHYSTLGIQTLDLGFIVPASFVVGYLLKKKNKWGYIFSIVLVCKAVTMTAAVSAMAYLMKFSGVSINTIELIVAPSLLISCSICLVKLIKHMKSLQLEKNIC